MLGSEQKCWYMGGGGEGGALVVKLATQCHLVNTSAACVKPYTLSVQRQHLENTTHSQQPAEPPPVC